MDSILLKLVEQTPALALLGLFLLFSFKMQATRDKDATLERQAFIEANKQLSQGFLLVVDKLEQQTKMHQEFNQVVMQAHQYQKMEHEQIVQAIQKLDNK